MSNRLKNESSPYLLLHAEQKIDWFPWGREAFAKAKEENKPIFLSIGYSTCHWCHVMAEESFDHDDIADILNRAFVSIKVDREEKPDVDAVYMNICNAMHGSGGWPLSVFLTPDQKPFFVGTYFPRESSGNRIGFRDLLLIIDEKWRSDRSGLEHTSEEIVDRISLFLKREKTDDTPDPFIEAFRSLSESYDSEFGGFGHGAKFPTPQKLLFLEEYFECEKDRNCYNMLKNTLDAMAGGGLYDAIGGGFFRYSVDRAFSLPHFEKMLRDNALLIIVYAKFYELSGDLFYLQIAEDTAFYLLSEMKSNDHCFFTAQDADSEGEEGGYYLFDKNELAQILGEEDAKRFVNRYGMKDKPTLNHKYLPVFGYDHLIDFSAADRKTVSAWRKENRKLFCDDKILTSQNAMAVAAFAVLYRMSGNKQYLIAAQQCYAALKSFVWDEHDLCRGFRNKKTLCAAISEDYAWMIFACINLYQSEPDDIFLKDAEYLFASAFDNHFDEKEGGFFLRSRKEESLILNLKSPEDTDAPSANGIMTENLRLLSILTGNDFYDRILKEQRRYMKKSLGNDLHTASFFLLVESRIANPPAHIRIVDQTKNDLFESIKDIPLRNIVIFQKPDKAFAMKDRCRTFYICREDRCLPPCHHLEKKDLLF